ncbi:pilus assembly protein [Rhizobium skierniewicense]|uniref:TadE/TadG family type IV pilus assembly protein n=1 Tax=Rhizobium skierniewicense TaxID=984260 RepID=UPI001FAB6D93|nr:pilus assembly protein [Rhizobium skierniewicense]
MSISSKISFLFNYFSLSSRTKDAEPRSEHSSTFVFKKISPLGMGDFVKDVRGNFGILTALCATPLIVVAGGSIDFSMATVERTKLQGYADAAALAGAGIYDGTNAKSAIGTAKRFLGSLSEKTAYEVSMTANNIHITIKGSSPNAFLGLIGMDSMPVSVAASATAPVLPKSVLLKPLDATGFFFKQISILVRRPGATLDTVVGTVTYQPTTRRDDGRGKMTVLPQEKFDLGKYSKLILRMDVKWDGCPLGYTSDLTKWDVVCTKLEERDPGYKSSLAYNAVVRTDDPTKSHHLFVDNTQLPKGVISPLDNLVECNRVAKHAWEDGGSWLRQDFFYTVQTTCAPNGQFVWLTK